MNERKAKVLEIIIRTICILSLLFIFICNSVKPTLICFICYYIYKTITAIIMFTKRMKDKEAYKIIDTILLSLIIICHIALVLVFLYYLFK